MLVDADVVLNYPPPEENVDQFNNGEASPSALSVIQTDNNMSLLIQIGTGDLLKPGQEILATDSNGDVVGAGQINEHGQCGLAVWGDDAATTVKDGLLNGETFALKLAGDQNTELAVEEILTGSGLVYQTDGLSVIKISTAAEIPEACCLTGVYPNPFNNQTTVTYGLSQSGEVTIGVYDCQGRLATSLLNQTQSAGLHSVRWDASDFSAGVYLIKMQVGSFQTTQKIMLLK